MASRETGIRVEGLSEVVRQLKALGLDVEDLKGAFSKVATYAEGRIVAHMPQRSGRLARSARGNRATSKAVVRIGSSRVPYAGVINYGWAARRIAPAGFVEEADREIQPRAVELLQNEIEAAIQRRGLGR